MTGVGAGEDTRARRSPAPPLSGRFTHAPRLSPRCPRLRRPAHRLPVAAQERRVQVLQGLRGPGRLREDSASPASAPSAPPTPTARTASAARPASASRSRPPRWPPRPAPRPECVADGECGSGKGCQAGKCVSTIEPACADPAAFTVPLRLRPVHRHRRLGGGPAEAGGLPRQGPGPPGPGRRPLRRPRHHPVQPGPRQEARRGGEEVPGRPRRRRAPSRPTPSARSSRSAARRPSPAGRGTAAPSSRSTADDHAPPRRARAAAGPLRLLGPAGEGPAARGARAAPRGRDQGAAAGARRPDPRAHLAGRQEAARGAGQARRAQHRLEDQGGRPRRGGHQAGRGAGPPEGRARGAAAQPGAAPASRWPSRARRPRRGWPR